MIALNLRRYGCRISELTQTYRTPTSNGTTTVMTGEPRDDRYYRTVAAATVIDGISPQ
jgi:hypothetical protein